MPLWTVSPVFQSGTALVAQLPDSATAGGNARGANAVDWQTVRSASAQVASGVNSVLSGGANNQSGGLNATVGGGNTNNATGESSTVGGGVFNTASGLHSWVPGGRSGLTRGLTGVGAWGSGGLVTGGDATAEEHLLRRAPTDATATRLTADNAVAGTLNTINLINFSAIAGQMTIVAKAAGSTAAATWRLNVSAVRGNGVGTVVVYEGAGTAIAPTASNGTGSAWRLDIAADTTNGGVAVTVTGAAATTINWVDRYSAVQVQTPS
jgi:hypothetical protein